MVGGRDDGGVCVAGRHRLLIIDVPSGGRLVSHTEGVMATVSVIEDGSGVATLHINNRQQEGSSATLLADARQALLPMLLHPVPQRALFLGVGTGMTRRLRPRTWRCASKPSSWCLRSSRPRRTSRARVRDAGRIRGCTC